VGDFGVPAMLDIAGTVVDSAGRLWIATRTEGLWYRAGGAFQRCEAEAGQLRGVTQVAECPQNTFWFVAGNRVLRWRDGQLRAYAPQPGWSSNDPPKILFPDRSGRLWLLTNRLFLLANPETDEFFQPIPVPPAENCRGIMEDLEGSYWIGTAGDGIVRMRATGFRMFAPEDAPLGGNTRTVAIDRQGVVWAGLTTTGAARIAPDGTTTVVNTGAGSDGEVWAIWPASDGSVWIGARGSLMVWRDGTVKRFPQYQRIRALYQDRAGTIWIGADIGGGVVRYQDSAFTSLDEAIGSSPENPIAYAFAEDAAGALYVGLLRRGVVKVKDGAVTSYESGDGAATDIRAIYPDQAGNLWVGTKGQGLAMLRKGRWWHADGLAGPFNENVSTLIEDDQGRFWIGTPQGIAWGPKAEFLAVALGERPGLNLHFATPSDGVRPGTVGAGSSPPAWKTADGAIWYASRRGLVAVETRNVILNRVAPPVRIERVLVDAKPVELTAEIRLPAGARTLEIDYTATSFVRPEQVHFRYRLEGHDRDWIDTAGRRTAYYNDLRPGAYRFQVIACNDDEVWNETGASMALAQTPYFYETGWFAGLVALGLAGLGFGFYSWRTTALRWRNEQLERRIAERTAELAKSYEELKQAQTVLLETSRLAGIAEMATGVLHNLGNALNSVNTTVNLTTDRVQKSKITALGKVVQLLEEQHGRLAEFFSTDPRGQQLPGYLAHLSGHLLAERTELLHELEALQQNVDHIKQIVAAQQSYAHVSGLTETVPAAELVEYGLRISEASLQRHDVAVVREFLPAPPVKVERQKVLQILVNLIRNAKEAINENGRTDKRLVVGVRVSAEGRVQIYVKDNGVGIAPENLTRVFAFGYTTKKAGHGFGLHSSANVAQEMGGSLVAQSDGPGHGATFILELPPAG
jgi:signal transduction histidine kinase/ligand-binding sensor domain-containing protein